MLIQCPECEQQVSDKAVSCPHCGFPIKNPNNSTPVRKNTNTGKNIKFGRLPNGFGSIKKLSGKRRKPYAVYTPVKGYDLNGKPIERKNIGYFSSYKEAYERLLDYHRNPLEDKEITFSQLYELFCENTSEHWKKGAERRYKQGYNYSEPLYNIPFVNIKQQTFQELLDSINIGYGSLCNIIGLWRNMSEYAQMNDLVSTNYASFVKIHKSNDIESGVPFTEDELKLFWSKRDNPDIQVLLIMIYTGMRIGELKEFEYSDNIITGGSKTNAGINRTIPIIPGIREYVDRLYKEGFKPNTYRNKYHWEKIMKECNTTHAQTGERHTPHDCRHTFSWLADKFKLDDMSKHLIMGHSLGSDVEANVYGHRTVDELVEEMNKIKIIK